MNTYNRLPVAFVDGRGARIRDTEGKEYLDFLGGIAVSVLGHGHPALVRAIKEAAEGVLHTSNVYYIEAQARLAARLAELSGLDRAFFANTGAEANEGAIKLARRYARRRKGEDRYKIVSALHSFHGRTMGAMTATGQPKFHDGFGPLPEGFEYVPLNDVAALEAAVDGRTAAVILEPIQGESGVRPCTPEYLQAARRICDQRGALLIFDEVQTGIGRTGKMFAFEHYGVRPDILSLAKALGGGIPIGVFLATEEVSRGFEPGVHGTTFGGNPFATKVAGAVLDVVIGEKLPERAAALGAHLKARLERLDGVAEVRGMGLMIGVELEEGLSAPRVMRAAFERGLLVGASGDAVLRVLPPLVISEADADEAAGILEAAIGAVREAAREESAAAKD
ncbi:MAG: aspartate aminotransferase family protein [Bacillota bacterium]|nr:MAG: aspartate aminotransferase family protein [Bacillota bacterium]